MITDIQARSAKPKEKPYMLRDDRGLYLRITPTGRKYWILRYWELGKEHQMSLGPYPAVSVQDARRHANEIQDARARGLSPSTTRSPLVQDVVKEWLNVRMAGLSAGYLKCVTLRVTKYILPALGQRAVDDVSSGEILRMCRRIEAAGHLETAKRIKVLAGQIFRFAIAAGYLENDPTSALAGALTQKPESHFATLTEPHQIRTLFQTCLGYPWPIMRAALLFSLYTAARPGEVRHAEWNEVKGEVWDIPAEKMKARRRHLVPLSKQCQEVIQELREYTGSGRWLFPSARDDTRPMSENGVRMALRGLGFEKSIITPHGFRAAFSTIANETGLWNQDAVERQLAHVEGNSVRRAYNHAQYLEERTRLMQWWADWLEGKA